MAEEAEMSKEECRMEGGRERRGGGDPSVTLRSGEKQSGPGWRQKRVPSYRWWIEGPMSGLGVEKSQRLVRAEAFGDGGQEEEGEEDQGEQGRGGRYAL